MSIAHHIIITSHVFLAPGHLYMNEERLCEFSQANNIRILKITTNTDLKGVGKKFDLEWTYLLLLICIY